jgi:hypothetical protein
MKPPKEQARDSILMRTLNSWIFWIGAVGAIFAASFLFQELGLGDSQGRSLSGNQGATQIGSSADKQAAADRERREAFEKWASVSAFVGCRTALRRQLRDPDSYKDEYSWSSPTPSVDHDAQTVRHTWQFRAKNGFGGYNVGIAECNTRPGSDGLEGYGAPVVSEL